MNENMIWLVPDLCGTIVNIKNYSLCLGRLSNKCRRDQYCALAHLSDDQINYVLSDIGSDVYLNACPGSGKTEVYMDLIDYTIKKGKSVIVLIPEIALTYQTVMRFTRRFKSKKYKIESRGR